MPDVGSMHPRPSHALTGQMLVAMPGIGDPRFERAVILIIAHDGDHAMGLTVNRPVDGLTLSHLLKQLGVTPAAGGQEELVLMGGPVEPERGFVLHTDDYAGEGATVQVGPGVALTATREILEALAGKTQRPRR